MRDLASKKRKKIYCDDVKVFQVAQYKGLRIEDMLEFAEDYPDVALALPLEPREILKLHRDYISTLIYTLVGDPFSDWVEEQTKTRNKYVEDKQDMHVHLDPEIAQIL